MRLYRLIARKLGGDYYVYADISGQGKRPVRAKLGLLADRDGIERKVDSIRKAVTLRDALSVREGM